MTRAVLATSKPIRELPPTVRVCSRCGIQWSCRRSSQAHMCRDCRSVESFIDVNAPGLRLPTGQEWRLLATDEECSMAHAAYQRGERDDRTKNLQREYDRRGRARRRGEAA